MLISDKVPLSLTSGVKVSKLPGYFVVTEDEQVVAKVKDRVKLDKQHYFTSKLLAEEKKELLSEQDVRERTSSNSSLKLSDPSSALSPLGFTPPDFGVTILGSSHGFDCKGSTSGYIVWINQRGVMVDPPPFSS